MEREILERLERIESRRARLEAPRAPAPPPPAPQPQPPKATGLFPPPPAPKKPAPAGIELGGTGGLLGFVAALCFVFASAYLVRLAVDAGWLTPERQLGLTALLGMGLIAAGSAPFEDKRYASLLPGAGVVVLYVAAYGGSLYWGLYDQPTTVMAAALVSMAALALYWRDGQDFYVVAALVGSYVSSLLLPGLREGGLDAMIFFAAWDVVYACLAVAMGSRVMVLLAAYLAIGCFSAAVPFGPQAQPVDIWAAAGFQALQLYVFLTATWFVSVRGDRPLTREEAWYFFPLLFFFYTIEFLLVDRVAPSLAPWLGIAFAVFLNVLQLVARGFLGGRRLDSDQMLSYFTGFVLLHAVYVELLPPWAKPWTAVLVLLAFALAYEPLRLGGDRIGYLYAGGALVGVEYLVNLFGVGAARGTELAAFNLAMGSLLLIGYGFREAVADGPKRLIDGGEEFLLAASSLQALAGIARVIVDSGLEDAPRYWTSMGWALWGAGLLGWAVSSKDRRLARAGAGILLATAGKTLLIDVASADAAVRIVCLLFLGAVLYLSGYLFRRVAEWQEGPIA